MKTRPGGARWRLVGLALTLAACAGRPGPPLATVPALDLDRYAETWYELARLPAPFQRDCLRARAEYRRHPDGGLAVTNSCVTTAGRVRSVTGRARAVDGSADARLLVTFDTFLARLAPRPVEGNYWVIHLDPGYRTSVVGTPDRRYLWILSRSPGLDDAEYGALVERARAAGFSVERLLRADWSAGWPEPQPS